MYKKIIFIIIVVLVLIKGVYGLYNISTANINNNEKITFYELKTSEYFDTINNGKYYINSLEELNKFYSLYSDVLNIDVNYLEDNSLFINTIEVGSGSITIKLKDVNLEKKKINFIIEKDIPEVSTDDMAFWYLVAVIPNNMLENVDVSDWSKPSSILNNIYVDK